VSRAEQEKTRWGLIVAGLAVAGVIVAWEWMGNTGDGLDIAQPAERGSRSGAASTERDFFANLNSRGITAAINPVSLLPQTYLHETTERPLFATTRRPPPKPLPIYREPPPPPPPPDPADLSLVGVMVGRDGAVALLRVKGLGQTIPVRRGEIVDGWTIGDIQSRQIEVTKDAVKATIVVSAVSSPGTEANADGNSAENDRLTNNVEQGRRPMLDENGVHILLPSASSESTASPSGDGGQ